jgi:hypothetical protein
LADLNPDIVEGEDRVDMGPALRLMRLVAELAEILSVEMIMEDHLSVAESLVEDIAALLPVREPSLPYTG